VEFAIETTRREGVELDLNGRVAHWRWRSTPEREAAVTSVTESLKLLPNDQKDSALNTLAERLDVDVPRTPPPRYSAMSWNDVRRCATMGVTFGPHTVTHPILTNVSATDATWEVRESWRRLREECNAVVPVFAYPNGFYSEREVSIIADSELRGALTSRPAYARRDALHAPDSSARCTVPRFPYSGDRAQFVQVVSGVERVKMAMRAVPAHRRSS
jgi:hypothetical protein